MKTKGLKGPGAMLGSGSRLLAAEFTLIETVVALPIGPVALVSLFPCFTGFNVVGFEREDLHATQIMLKQLERIRPVQ